jgi:uncharacterized protein (DUF2141 family)
MRIIILFISLIISICAYTQQIEVLITGIPNNNGKIMLTLYKGETNFLKNAYRELALTINNDKAQGMIDNIPLGEYAIAVYHDENNNSKLDTYFIGIPKEKVAASNKAKGKNGPPKYQDAKFVVKNGKNTQHIVFDKD